MTSSGFDQYIANVGKRGHTHDTDTYIVCSLSKGNDPIHDHPLDLALPSTMFIKQQFLSFPPNFVSARAEVVMSTQGSSVAIFGEWLACYFTPQIERLLSSKRMTVCDNIQVREVLELSGDWDRLTTAMKQLKLPPQSYEMLHAKTVELRVKIGEYWSRYNAAMEKPGDLWVPISPKDMMQIEDWFTKLKIDEAAFQQRVTHDGRYPVFWQIVEKGLCLHLRKEKSWVSLNS